MRTSITPASFALAASLTLVLMAITASYLPARVIEAKAPIRAETMTAVVLPTVHVVASR